MVDVVAGRGSRDQAVGRGDRAGDGRHPPAPLREGELPVRERESLHESVVLSYSKANRTKFVMLRSEEIDSVLSATARYRETKAALEAQAEAEAGLAALIARRRPKR
jgi:hypothetical protein